VTAHSVRAKGAIPILAGNTIVADYKQHPQPYAPVAFKVESGTPFEGNFGVERLK
jgi:hypothetical protein